MEWLRGNGKEGNKRGRKKRRIRRRERRGGGIEVQREKIVEKEWSDKLLVVMVIKQHHITLILKLYQ